MRAITSEDMAAFLNDRVNLKADAVRGYRAQVRYLRERLECYVAEHPDFELIKMLHYGSLAKGTAISTFCEMDLAAYLDPERSRGKALAEVLQTMRALLIDVYPQMAPSQFVIDPPAVTITYSTSGLKVDVVPVIPNGKGDDRGLLAMSAPEWVETSIPLHLDFIRKRSARHAQFRELVRLTKWWRQEHDLDFCSFLIELVWAHLVDTKPISEDYQEAMLTFFAYIERSRLEERIAFSDNYKLSAVNTSPALVQIIDPVNPSNNVADSMTRSARDAILFAAESAVDDVAAGSSAYSKATGVECYQQVFGTAFAA